MAFNTKRTLDDTKYIQSAGKTLNLSGDTNIGYGEYLTDKSGVYVARSLVDAEYVTGQTAGKLDCTDFNSYTGDRETRLGDIETDVTTISGDVITNAADIQLVSGVTTTNTNNITTISGDVIQNTNDITTISGDVIDNRTDINTNINDISNLGDLSGITEASITGVTNGLTKVGSHSAKLGGSDLTENTTIGLGTYNMILGSYSSFQSSIQISDANGIIIGHGTNGTMKFDSNGITSIGNQGIKYNACFHANYDNRSLVDKEYVDNASGAIQASNGLTRVDDNITLGGSLTGNTTINLATSDLKFSGDSVQYTADYSSTYVARSLVDAEFVTGLTSQAILTANNGLTKDDTNVRLGGSLTGVTTVDTNLFGVVIGDAGTITGENSVVLARGSVSGNCAVAMSNGIAGGAKSIAFSKLDVCLI